MVIDLTTIKLWEFLYGNAFIKSQTYGVVGFEGSTSQQDDYNVSEFYYI